MGFRGSLIAVTEPEARQWYAAQAVEHGWSRAALTHPIATNRLHAGAVAILNDVVMGNDVVEYLQRIDSTLGPFGGHFLIHGGQPDVREGQWNGDLIVLRFPASDAARRWYDSAAYQAIAPLRATNSRGTVAHFEGVDPDHHATDVLNG